MDTKQNDLEIETNVSDQAGVRNATGDKNGTTAVIDTVTGEQPKRRRTRNTKLSGPELLKKCGDHLAAVSEIYAAWTSGEGVNNPKARLVDELACWLDELQN